MRRDSVKPFPFTLGWFGGVFRRLPWFCGNTHVGVMIVLLLCTPVVPLRFHPIHGDTMGLAGGGNGLCHLCSWGPGALLSAQRAGARAAVLADSCHTRALSHLRVLLAQGAQGQCRAHISERLGCVQSSPLSPWLQFPFPRLAATPGCSIPGDSGCAHSCRKQQGCRSREEISRYSLPLFCCLKRKWKVVWIFTGWNSEISENSLQELQHCFSALLQSSFISQISVSVTVLIALPGFVVLMQHSELYFWGLIWKTISCWKLFICLAVSLKK